MSLIKKYKDKILSLYTNFDNIKIDIKNTSRGEDDKRYTLIPENKECNIVIKLTNNKFTTKERVLGWQKLIEKYINLGVYSPKIIRSLNGNISEYIDIEGERFIVYGEELKKYKTIDEFDLPIDREIYNGQLMELIGKVANSEDIKVKWKSPYVLYDVFSNDDTMDENYECAVQVFYILMDKIQEEKYRIRKIIERYYSLRTDLRDTYIKLPEANFQADLNKTNIMLDDELNFKGIIDFNVSGMEKILNYSLSESFYYLRKEDLDKGIMKKENILKRDNYLKNNMDIIGRYYKFTKEEQNIYNELYNMTIPFRWANYCLYMYIFRENKEKYYKDILDYIYFEIMRDDIKI